MKLQKSQVNFIEDILFFFDHIKVWRKPRSLSCIVTFESRLWNFTKFHSFNFSLLSSQLGTCNQDLWRKRICVRSDWCWLHGCRWFLQSDESISWLYWNRSVTFPETKPKTSPKLQSALVPKSALADKFILCAALHEVKMVPYLWHLICAWCGRYGLCDELRCAGICDHGNVWVWVWVLTVECRHVSVDLCGGCVLACFVFAMVWSCKLTERGPIHFLITADHVPHQWLK